MTTLTSCPIDHARQLMGVWHQTTTHQAWCTCNVSLRALKPHSLFDHPRLALLINTCVPVHSSLLSLLQLQYLEVSSSFTAVHTVLDVSCFSCFGIVLGTHADTAPSASMAQVASASRSLCRSGCCSRCCSHLCCCCCDCHSYTSAAATLDMRFTIGTSADVDRGCSTQWCSAAMASMICLRCPQLMSAMLSAQLKPLLLHLHTPLTTL